MGEASLAPVGPGDHVIGASDPELTLIKYGDFGCQFRYDITRALRQAWRPPSAGAT